MVSAGAVIGYLFLALVAGFAIWFLYLGASDFSSGFLSDYPEGLILSVLGGGILIAAAVVLIGGKLKGGVGKVWGEAHGPRQRRKS